METKRSPKSVKQLVEEQCLRWKETQKEKPKAERVPIIAVSRQEGTLAGPVAKILAGKLKLDIYESRLIKEVADNTRLSEEVVKTLDEKSRTSVDDLFADLEDKLGMTSDGFFAHLVKVIGAIERHGAGIIIGRGASIILDRKKNLKVRFIAPLEMRIGNVAETLNLPIEEAEKHIRKVDANRRAFLRKYFNVSFEDVSYFDLVINNEFIDAETSAGIIEAAFEKKRRL